MFVRKKGFLEFFSRIALFKNVLCVCVRVCVCVCVCVCVRACACVCVIVAPGHVLDMETGTCTVYISKKIPSRSLTLIYSDNVGSMCLCTNRSSSPCKAVCCSGHKPIRHHPALPASQTWAVLRILQSLGSIWHFP